MCVNKAKSGILPLWNFRDEEAVRRLVGGTVLSYREGVQVFRYSGQQKNDS